MKYTFEREGFSDSKTKYILEMSIEDVGIFYDVSICVYKNGRKKVLYTTQSRKRKSQLKLFVRKKHINKLLFLIESYPKGVCDCSVEYISIAIFKDEINNVVSSL